MDLASDSIDENESSEQKEEDLPFESPKRQKENPADDNAMKK